MFGKKAYMKKYRISHKEEIKKQRKQYRIDNKEKIFERYKQWHLDNPEYNREYYRKNKEQRKKWADEHKDYKREYDKIYCQEHISNRNEENYREWQEKNREKIMANSKQWRKENKEHTSKYSKQYLQTEMGRTVSQRARSKRRAREKYIINTLTFQEWITILEAYNYRCAYCGVEFEVENMPTKDHIIPISKGGNNIKENIVPACRSCNAEKGIKLIEKGGVAIC